MHSNTESQHSVQTCTQAAKGTLRLRKSCCQLEWAMSDPTTCRSGDRVFWRAERMAGRCLISYGPKVSIAPLAKEVATTCAPNDVRTK